MLGSLLLARVRLERASFDMTSATAGHAFGRPVSSPVPACVTALDGLVLAGVEAEEDVVAALGTVLDFALLEQAVADAASSSAPVQVTNIRVRIASPGSARLRCRRHEDNQAAVTNA